MIDILKEIGLGFVEILASILVIAATIVVIGIVVMVKALLVVTPLLLAAWIVLHLMAMFGLISGVPLATASLIAVA